MQGIFGGEIGDWGTLGSTSLTTSGSTPLAGSGQAGSGQAGLSRLRPEATPRQAIKAFGLRADDPATGIFEKECLSRYKWKRVEIKKGSAEAVAAVSMDPQAVALVDLAGIPATGQNVRVLGIRLRTSQPRAAVPQERVYYPTPENIKNAMYPLSQRLWLYVHPQASETAKDFAKFIATCGGSTSLTAGASEASPYADTVKAVMDTYRKHGLVPLADAAIQRMVKDAMAADAAKAARSAPSAGSGRVGSGQEAGKGKGKGSR